jgi:hypothetical protein
VTLVRLTHANFKRSIYVAKELIAGFYHSEAHACTHVVASGGAVFPASESVDDVKRLLEGGANAVPISQEEKK